MHVNGQTEIYPIIFLSIVLVIALVSDMRVYKIPNMLTYPGMALALIFHAVSNGTSGFLFSALGLMVGTGIFLFPFIFGFMGAGDAKLMGTVGAVLGVRGVLNACVFTAIAGGVLAMILLLLHNRNFKFISRYAVAVSASIAERRFIWVPPAEKEVKPKVYYALAIAAGTLYTVCWKAAFYSFPL